MAEDNWAMQYQKTNFNDFHFINYTRIIKKNVFWGLHQFQLEKLM